MVDLHTHDMFSRFDGFGKPSELAKLAKELGHTSLSTSNHGNVNGLIQTYNACKKVGIKPILGVEGYFLPVYIPQRRGYHLCLFCKNLDGYKNLNTLMYEGDKQKFYNPIITFEMLEKYHNGLICTSACVSSFSSRAIASGKLDIAKKYLIRMKEIFEDDFYIEIQPYAVSEKGLQEKVNRAMFKFAQDLKIKMILTSDSHYGDKKDFPSYLKMHQIDGHDLEDIKRTYEERYKPTEEELIKRFIMMHSCNYGSSTRKFALRMIKNLEEIENKVDGDLLDGLEISLPSLGEKDNYEIIKSDVIKGLKKREKYNHEYVTRCKEELEVIKTNGYVDYFLIVADYVKYAKDRGVIVGPGRGSVCNSLVAYALGITEVDSIYFDLDFRRFLRMDKKDFPDIDIDFETERRDEVIEYLLKKYPGKSAKVASYGLYKIDNAINDLAKVCGLEIDKSLDVSERDQNKQVISEIKKLVNRYKNEEGEIDQDALLNGADSRTVKRYDQIYDNIITHFLKLYGKVRYIGTHAAGVVVTSGDILSYTSLTTDKNGKVYSVYSLDDLNDVKLIKFDMLGLKTMQSIGECRKLAHKENFDIYKAVSDKKIMEKFASGETEGIFQFERKAAKDMFISIRADCFNDIAAVNAMNRPAPLAQGIPDTYAHNKVNHETNKNRLLRTFTQGTYGTIVYQEQLLLISVNIGGFTWQEGDKMLKASKHSADKGQAYKVLREYEEETGIDLHRKFVDNARKNGLKKNESENLWQSLLVYSFNRGHAVGYSIISVEEMYYKVHYPVFFWYSKIKYAGNDSDRERYCNLCVADDVVVFLPHVNYSRSKTSLRKVDGEYVIQKGMADLKDVGEKAALKILEERRQNGAFVSYDDFYDRCYGGAVNKKVVEVLTRFGALNFDKEKYIKSVITYNASMLARAKRS